MRNTISIYRYTLTHTVYTTFCGFARTTARFYVNLSYNWALLTDNFNYDTSDMCEIMETNIGASLTGKPLIFRKCGAGVHSSSDAIPDGSFVGKFDLMFLRFTDHLDIRICQSGVQIGITFFPIGFEGSDHLDLRALLRKILC